jgi:hypothetical protein
MSDESYLFEIPTLMALHRFAQMATVAAAISDEDRVKTQILYLHTKGVSYSKRSVFVRSFDRSFVCLFVCSFVCLFVCLFVSIAHLLVLSSSPVIK